MADRHPSHETDAARVSPAHDLARALAPVLSRALAAGRESHGGFALSEGAFSAHVVRRLAERLARGGQSGTPLAARALLERSAHADLYLAAACEAGDEAAWRALVAQYAHRLEALALGRGARPAAAEGAARDLLSALALPAPAGRARTLIGTYDGSGSLFGWLAVILVRRLWADRAWRATDPEAAGPRAASPPAEVPGHTTEPLERLVRHELEAATRTALDRAWAQMTPNERAALVLTHRDGASGRALARLLGVGAPRASRLVGQATAKVRRALLPVLGARGAAGIESAGSWEALRDAVGAHLAAVATPEGARAPSQGGRPPPRGSP